MVDDRRGGVSSAKSHPTDFFCVLSIPSQTDGGLAMFSNYIFTGACVYTSRSFITSPFFVVFVLSLLLLLQNVVKFLKYARVSAFVFIRIVHDFPFVLSMIE